MKKKVMFNEIFAQIKIFPTLLLRLYNLDSEIPHFVDFTIFLFFSALNLVLYEIDNGLEVKGVPLVNYEGSNYTVCRDHWTDTEANIVCNSMGYFGGKAWEPPNNLNITYK